MTTLAPPPPVALVTGGAKRIGRAFVDDLAACGYAVAIHYSQSKDEAEAAAEAIRGKGGAAAAVKADLGVEAETESLIDQAQTALGPIGVLINNASTFAYDSAASADRASWDHHMEPNLRAPFILAQRFAAALPDGHSGLIVNLLDQRVWRLTQHFMTYTISKMGLWTLTRSLALGLAPEIRVNAIGPGPTLPSTRQTELSFAQQVARTPLARQPDLAEFTAALRFFLAAPSVTGQMIAIDSGQHLGEAGGAAPLE